MLDQESTPPDVFAALTLAGYSYKEFGISYTKLLGPLQLSILHIGDYWTVSASKTNTWASVSLGIHDLEFNANFISWYEQRLLVALDVLEQPIPTNPPDTTA